MPMASFTSARKTWALLGVGTNIGYNWNPPEALDWLGPDAPDRAKQYVGNGIAAGKAGMPYNLDNWGGYPQAKARLLKAAQAADVNLVAVTGDSHNGWAFDLQQDGKAAGVEYGGHSVTSPGMEQGFKSTDPSVIAKGVVAPF